MKSSSKSRPFARAGRLAALLLASAAGASAFAPVALRAEEVPPPTGEPAAPAAPAPPTAPARAPETAPPVAPGPPSAREPIAVLPLDNLSGHPLELAPLRDALKAALEREGRTLLDDAALEAFLEKHRIRWTGGLSDEASAALALETGARSALVTTLLTEDPSSPPRIAIAARLVALGETPHIAWMDSESEAGDDTPGFLSLKLVDDPAFLEDRTIGRLAHLLAIHLAAPGDGADASAESLASARGRYRPRRSYRSPHLELSPAAPARVAVLPFKDESRRRRAGDILPLLLVQHFASSPVIDVLEPGTVRETLLQNRVIMEGGVSLAQVEVIRSLLQVDYVVTGTVAEFGEFPGRNGSPRVQFTVRVIDARTNQAVWSSISHNEGEDGVFFFGCGRIRSASALASEMARQVAAGFADTR